MKKKKSQSSGTRAVAYIRVSTEKQASEGVSLDAQASKISAYCLCYGITLVATEIDAGESAGSLEREGLQRALARLDAFEADALLVVKLDRLTRSVRDLCDLVDAYFRDGTYSLLSVTEQIDTRSASGRMVLNVLTAIGQWEREAIGERTAAALQHMKASGQYTGGWPPYGFREVDGKLEEDWSEMTLVKRARDLREAGFTLRGIAHDLGNNPRTGKPFAASQIVRML